MPAFTRKGLERKAPTGFHAAGYPGWGGCSVRAYFQPSGQWRAALCHFLCAGLVVDAEGRGVDECRLGRWRARSGGWRLGALPDEHAGRLPGPCRAAADAETAAPAPVDPGIHGQFGLSGRVDDARLHRGDGGNFSDPRFGLVVAALRYCRGMGGGDHSPPPAPLNPVHRFQAS